MNSTSNFTVDVIFESGLECHAPSIIPEAQTWRHRLEVQEVINGKNGYHSY